MSKRKGMTTLEEEGKAPSSSSSLFRNVCHGFLDVKKNQSL